MKLMNWNGGVMREVGQLEEQSEKGAGEIDHVETGSEGEESEETLLD